MKTQQKGFTPKTQDTNALEDDFSVILRGTEAVFQVPKIKNIKEARKTVRLMGGESGDELEDDINLALALAMSCCTSWGDYPIEIESFDELTLTEMYSLMEVFAPFTGRPEDTKS